MLNEKAVYTSFNATGDLLRSTAPLSLLRALSLIAFTMKSNLLLSNLRTNYHVFASLAYIRRKYLYQFMLRVLTSIQIIIVIRKIMLVLIAYK